MGAESVKLVAQNKKARHDYFIEETYEAGIVLTGTEVKSIRMGRVNLKDCYANVRGGEVFLYGMHISPYEKGNIHNADPIRTRKLLLNKREIRHLIGYTQQEGRTLIPTKLYLKGSLVKVELAVAKGKKQYDKRHAQAERDAKRKMDKAVKEYNR